MSMIDLPKGQVLFHQGDEGDAAYIVESGQVYIYKVQDQEEIPLSVIGQGDIFGEMSLLDNLARSASARALVDCTLSVVTKNQIFARLQTADSVVKLLMNVLLKRLRMADTYIPFQPANLTDSQNINKAKIQDLDAIGQIKFENLIFEAFHNHQFELYYQPIINFKQRKIVGAESLLRWKDPVKGYVSPDVFIDIIEHSSMVLPIGLWILDQSMQDLQGLIVSKKCPDFVISINVSTKQFADPLFVEQLERIRSKHQLSAASIKLEVTERIMTEGPVVMESLRQCRALGYGIAIDDFGTGFSSLQYLASMPITCLKVDRSFVMKVNTDAKVKAIVKSLIQMAKSLGLEVIAEGLETKSECHSLAKMGADMGQGFFFSKPIPWSAFLQLPGLITGYVTKI